MFYLNENNDKLVIEKITKRSPVGLAPNCI